MCGKNVSQEQGFHAGCKQRRTTLLSCKQVFIVFRGSERASTICPAIEQWRGLPSHRAQIIESAEIMLSRDEAQLTSFAVVGN
jgi:hypothetical protein